MTITDQIELLCAGTEQVISREELRKKLETGRRLRIKLGFDPTSPDLHLGHAVVLDKVAQFQQLGHLAVIIVGDYTARIGDPTGRSKTRVPLDPEKIAANARTYTEQVFKILDPDKTEIRHNSEWFDRFTYADVLKLNAQMTVSQLLAREDFRKRFEADQSITVTEFQYPFMQGHDSVVVHSDVELGGNDQLFNNLVGRDLQRDAGQEPQVVMVIPILEGTDGVEKMSKSLSNTIGISEPPAEIFGKTMRITDELMAKWTLALFGESVDPLRHPMESKKRLAHRLVARFHSESEATAARENFESVFSKNELPTEMPEFSFTENPLGLIKLVTEIKAAPSGSEARRLIAQGGVSLNGEKVSDPKHLVTLGAEPIVLKCGKRFYARIRKA